MKVSKLYLVLLVAFLTVLTACTTNEDIHKQEDTTAPVISGIKAIYHEIGQATPNYLNGVTAFDETDGNVTASIIVDSKDVNLGVEGVYNVTYYAFDLSQNKSSETTTVNVSAPDVVDLTAPDYPTRNYVVAADMTTHVEIGDPDAKLTTKPPLITVEYNEQAAQDLSWNTTYTIELSKQNYARKTQFGINVLGSGTSIYLKLLTQSDELIFEREVASTILWREVLINIPTTHRHLLNEALKLQVVAPKPSTSGIAGQVMISGIWFEGDDEPAVKLEYDPELFTTIYEVDISDFSNQHDSFDDQGVAANGLITASYLELSNTVEFVNNGFNEWANMAYRIPDKDSEGATLALSEVTLIVIEISVTEGAIVKAQNDWNSGDLFEFNETTDGTKQTWILPVGPNGYAVWAAITIAPSYLREGTTQSTIVLYSIRLVKPNSEA